MDSINCSAFSDNNVCRGRGMRELTVVTSPGSWSIGILISGNGDSWNNGPGSVWWPRRWGTRSFTFDFLILRTQHHDQLNCRYKHRCTLFSWMNDGRWGGTEVPCQLWPCYRHLMDSGQSSLSLSLSYKVLRAFKPIPGGVCVIKRLSRIFIGSTINTRLAIEIRGCKAM